MLAWVCRLYRGFETSLFQIFNPINFRATAPDKMNASPKPHSATIKQTEMTKSTTPRKSKSLDLHDTYGKNAASEESEHGDFLSDAILSPRPSNTRRWRHKKHFQTIIGHKRYQLGSPTQALTPDSMEADMRRLSIRDSLDTILDNIDKPYLD